jgi:hypothetical protein
VTRRRRCRTKTVYVFVELAALPATSECGALSSAAVRVPLTQMPNAFATDGGGPRSATPPLMLKRNTLPGAAV